MTFACLAAAMICSLGQGRIVLTLIRPTLLPFSSYRIDHASQDLGTQLVGALSNRVLVLLYLGT